MKTDTKLIPLLLLIWMALSAAHSYAKPTYAREFKQFYGYTPSCHACHKDGGGTPINQFGQDYKDQGNNISAFKLIAELDSDQDGFANGIEVAKKANPGHPKSTPGNKGNWLDLSSLIPNEVQALFPKATAWKPLDALLTEKDIERAKGLGVELSRDDENMIYIPVAERRPIGTALIFPVEYQSETFFLLMATDRQLNISEVKPLSSQTLPFELDGALFKGFASQALQSVSLAEGDDLAVSISQAVKRAGALVYIRLKGA
jgi:hypothetical protein